MSMYVRTIHSWSDVIVAENFQKLKKKTIFKSASNNFSNKLLRVFFFFEREISEYPEKRPRGLWTAPYYCYWKKHHLSMAMVKFVNNFWEIFLKEFHNSRKHPWGIPKAFMQAIPEKILARMSRRNAAKTVLIKSIESLAKFRMNYLKKFWRNWLANLCRNFWSNSRQIFLKEP